MARTGTNRQTAFHVEGMRELLRALSTIPRELQNDVRDASSAIANDLLTGAKNAAHTPQATLAASGLKVRRDRVPVLSAGTNSVRDGVRAMDVFYGAEFGGQRRSTTMQFPAWRGNSSGAGYFLYPTARERGKRYYDMWADAVDKAFRDWEYTAR